MESVVVYLIPGGDMIDVEFNPAEGVDPSNTESLCNDAGFIEAVKRETGYEKFILIQAFDVEEKAFDGSVVCVYCRKYAGKESIGDDYDKIFRLKGKQKREASSKLSVYVDAMKGIENNEAVINGLTSLICHTDRINNDTKAPRSIRDKADPLLTEVMELYSMANEGKVFNAVEMPVFKTCVSPVPKTKESLEKIQSCYNVFMGRLYEACNSFVSLWTRYHSCSFVDASPDVNPDYRPSVSTENLDAELKECRKRVEEYETEFKGYISRDIKQKKKISDLESRVKQLEEELKRERKCAKCEEHESEIEELKADLERKDKQQEELECAVTKLEDELKKKQSDVLEWRRKYNELYAIYSASSQQISQFKWASSVHP